MYGMVPVATQQLHKLELIFQLIPGHFIVEKLSQKKNKIELAVCLVKKNPMEMILQKATELGVSKIIPIISERSEVKELNNDRAKKIVIEATEQSNQMSPPEILSLIHI